MIDRKEEVLRHRRALYFDCIVGAGLGIFSLTLIILSARFVQVSNIGPYLFNLGFWIFFLGVAVTFIVIGLRGFYLEKKYPDGVPTKKKIRAPMVS